MYRMGKTEAHAGMRPPPVVRKSKRRKRSGNLVIVESPAKARTVGRFLGKDYKVMASIGHVRDLLRSQLSVDIENNFMPKYRVPNDKRQVVKELKAAAGKAETVYLATDPDREGEAIAWHLLEAADIEPEFAKRVVFHEITKEAIERAFTDPREIADNLVDAQQARRILDRLVGYNLSPLLWAKVRGRLSAGRVQSAALRLLVEREREIREFVPKEYWSIDAEFQNSEKPPAFRARLVQIDGKKPDIGTEPEANAILHTMRQASYSVSDVRRGTRVRRPKAPFTTSTMQQTASRRLGYTARRTMVIAQQLYEGIDLGEGDRLGLITYMRTDSTQISDKALTAVRGYIKDRFGKEFLPDKPLTYRTKTRRAQEAHEAVRPTAVRRSPESIKEHLSEEQFKLYSLIWSRFIASQMNPAVYDTLAIEVLGDSPVNTYLLRVTASSLRFSGFLKVYGDVESKNGGRNEKDDEKDSFKARLAQLPDLKPGDPLRLIDLFPEQHFTQPPNRYSDATLVRALEEHGIGRPSTYAPIISTLRRRGYMEREKRRLTPTEIGETVNDLIVEHFPDIVDLGFTARMESELDEIADGDREWTDVLREFYGPFSEQLKLAEELMPEVKAEPEEIGRACPECGKPLVTRHGRFGKFIGCSDFPTCKHTEPWLEHIGVRCPQCDGELVQRRTRKGRTFYGCMNYPECDFSSWKRPLPQPCPDCHSLLVVDNRTHASCTSCGARFEQKDLPQVEGDLA
jgi:DNA topoisomerase-1